jgi:hypothetical protein
MRASEFRSDGRRSARETEQRLKGKQLVEGKGGSK